MMTLTRVHSSNLRPLTRSTGSPQRATFCLPALLLLLATTPAGLAATISSSTELGRSETGEDEASSVVRFDERAYETREASGVALVTVVRRGDGVGVASVFVSLEPGTATPTADYTQAVFPSLVWDDGETGLKTISIAIVDDGEAERTETIQLMLVDPSGAMVDDSHGTAKVLILDDDRDDQPDVAGAIGFASGGFQAIESAGEAVVGVTRRGGSRGAASVDVISESGTATTGEDYEDVLETLVWADGEGGTREVRIPVLADDLEEGNETVLLQLEQLEGEATLDDDRDRASLDILDDDSTVTACAPDESTLCLQQSRFQVQVTWRTADGSSGPGRAVPLSGSSDGSGIFWFFSPDNAEMLVKVLDACAVPGLEAYWVFFAATTDVDFTMTVVDTTTGLTKQYGNLLGDSASPVQDTSTFQSCSL